MAHLDTLGNEIKVGDMVVYVSSTTGGFDWKGVHEVMDLTKDKVRLFPLRYKYVVTSTTPYKVYSTLVKAENVLVVNKILEEGKEEC